jgi:hypothetical protein
MFGAPNGLCSSITESKHIKAVKEPYRHSNCFEAMGQMLLTNQRLDKLMACCVHFAAHSMLDGLCLASHLDPIPPPLPLPHDPDDDAAEGPRVLASVSLALSRGRSTFFLIYILKLMLCST